SAFVDSIFAGYPPWVDEWLQELLNRDWRAFKILQFSIYCPRTQSGPEEDLVCQKGERLWYFYGSIKIEEKVAPHISNRCGAVAVAVGDHRQPPPGTPGESEETHQLRQYPTDSKKPPHSLSRKVDMQTESVQLSNHSKWVQSRIAQARRKPTITITEL
ncbi:uncharacterized protein N7506_003892, partial [Penicillium brevicompactum]|uniref:uncharacterized protein n=1 Tax=Penicillium brevicompactum TaxID=5074 RepID=UPI00254044FE